MRRERRWPLIVTIAILMTALYVGMKVQASYYRPAPAIAPWDKPISDGGWKWDPQSRGMTRSFSSPAPAALQPGPMLPCGHQQTGFTAGGGGPTVYTCMQGHRFTKTFGGIFVPYD